MRPTGDRCKKSDREVEKQASNQDARSTVRGPMHRRYSREPQQIVSRAPLNHPLDTRVLMDNPVHNTKRRLSRLCSTSQSRVSNF